MSWSVDSNGACYDNHRSRLGFFDTNGDVYKRDQIGSFGQPSGSPAGFVDINGESYDEMHQNMGFVDSDGLIYDRYHMIIASINESGECFDLAKMPIGNVSLSLHRIVHNTEWRPMYYRAAAAVLLILNDNKK